MSSSASTTLPRLGVLFVHTANAASPRCRHLGPRVDHRRARPVDPRAARCVCDGYGATVHPHLRSPPSHSRLAGDPCRLRPGGVRPVPQRKDSGLSGRGACAVGSLARLAVYIRRKRIALIHTSDRPRDASACVLLARLTRTKCIVHSHVKYDTWMSRPLRWSLMHADARIAVSEFVARSLVETGHNRSRTHVVLNAIDLERWKPGIGRAETRLELGLPADAPVVVTVCRLMPSKGSAELIRALALVRQTLPDVRLVIVGHDLSVDGSFARELRRLAEECDMADQRRLHRATRRRPPADGGCGRLCAAVGRGAVRARVPRGHGDEAPRRRARQWRYSGGGRAWAEWPPLRARRHEALASHLLTLLSDPSLRRRMGEYGRRQVEQRSPAGRMARDTADVYRLVACNWVDGAQ